LIIVFLVVHLLGYVVPYDWFLFYPEPRVDSAKWWVSLISHQFAHINLDHMAGNVVSMFAFSLYLECAVGKMKTLAIYLVSGLVAALTFAINDPGLSLIGASGAISGVQVAALMCLRAHRPFLASFMVCMLIYMEVTTLASSILSFRPTNIAYWAHFGGYLSGLFLSAWTTEDKL